MRKRYLLLVSLLLTLTSFSAQSEWHAITLYPPSGVYHADFLPPMVAAVESLWTVQNAHTQPILDVIDSIASMNVIVAENNDVRFRRIIELQELDDEGIQRMRALVDTHPLVQRRLVSADGGATHLWLQMRQPVATDSLQQLMSQLQNSLEQHMHIQCRSVGAQHGTLANRYLTQWHYQSTTNTSSLTALEALSKAQQYLASNIQGADVQGSQYYSALDLLAYLGRILDPDLINRHGLPDSDMAVAQMYLLADSLRSRDLQALASPDFRQLQMVIMGHNKPLPAPPVSGYQLSHRRQWQGNVKNYGVLDCRPNTQIFAEH